MNLLKQSLRGPAVWLFLLLLAAYAYFFPRWADWGQNSKLDLTMAIVDQGTFVIDDYYQNTGDYALYQGKHYSDKAPGTSFLGVPFYALFKGLASTSLVDNLINRLANNPAMNATLREDGSGLLYDKVYQAMALYVVTFFTVSLPSAFLGALLYVFLGDFIPNRRIRILAVLLYGLGTVAFPYAQTLNGRQIAAVLHITSFYLLFRMRRKELATRWLWLVGLLMGYAFITDYPSVFILAALFFYAVLGLRDSDSARFNVADLRKFIPFVVAGALPVLLMMFYNYRCFDTVLPVGYKYSALYQDVHSQGLISITAPHWEAIYGLTFSPFRGMFYLSPALLLAIPGFVYWFRKNSLRAEFWVVLWSVGITFLFYGSSVMWWGGFAVGPAYLAAMIPMLAFPFAYFLDRHAGHAWVQALAVALVVLSIALIWAETIAGQSFPDMTPNPLWRISLPALAGGDIARNLGMILKLQGPASLLPLAVVMVALLAVIFRQAGQADSQR
ncbi:MAG: hypothetical protein ACOYYS_13885 [Chloroflexota bacterium]